MSRLRKGFYRWRKRAAEDTLEYELQLEDQARMEQGTKTFERMYRRALSRLRNKHVMICYRKLKQHWIEQKENRVKIARSLAKMRYHTLARSFARLKEDSKACKEHKWRVAQCLNRMRWKFKALSLERWKELCATRKRCREVMSRAVSCWRRSTLRVGIISFRRNASINAMHERYRARDEKRTKIKVSLFADRLGDAHLLLHFRAWKDSFFFERRSCQILETSAAKRTHRTLARCVKQWTLFTTQRKYFKTVVGGCLQRYKQRETLCGFLRLKRLAVAHKHETDLTALRTKHEIEQLEREVSIMRHKQILVTRFARRIREKLKWKAWMRFSEISKAVKSRKIAIERAVARWRRNRLWRALQAFTLVVAERKRLRGIINSVVSRYKKQGETYGFLKLRRYAKMCAGEDKATLSK